MENGGKFVVVMVGEYVIHSTVFVQILLNSQTKIVNRIRGVLFAIWLPNLKESKIVGWRFKSKIESNRFQWSKKRVELK